MTNDPYGGWIHEVFWELTGFGFHRNSEVKRVRARTIPGWVTHWKVLVANSWLEVCRRGRRAPKGSGLALIPNCHISAQAPTTSRARLYRSTILSALGPDHALTILFLGTHTRTSLWVTHLGITLGQTRLTSKFLWNPKPMSSQKASRPRPHTSGPRCDNLVLEPIPSRKCADEDIGPLREVDCNIPHRPGKWILTRPFGSLLASGSVGTPKLSEFTQEQSQDGNKIMRAWSEPKADNIVLRWSRAQDAVMARTGM
ncbi:hypothetical protein DVH24_017035 [Malus domestica]|uniref:Uncharacterized protein n=1 Tax=Malus domestica TaxID=3750 RepID=A0A498IVX2_MALDO|nr:hypothetical protein DVH24_017035 [Malus domestica]